MKFGFARAVRRLGPTSSATSINPAHVHANKTPHVTMFCLTISRATVLILNPQLTYNNFIINHMRNAHHHRYSEQSPRVML